MSDKDNKDLKDLFDEASKSSEKDLKDKLKNESEKTNKTPIIIAVVVLIVIIASIFFLIPKIKDNGDDKGTKSSESVVIDDNTDPEKIDEKDIEKNTANEIEEIYKNNKTPVKVSDWTKKPFNEELTDKEKKTLQEGVANYALENQIGNYFGLLPSEKDGYTSDVNKATNKDGTPNLDYSYQTKENMEYVFSTYMQRLLNPIYGGWYVIPHGVPGEIEEGFPSPIFEDMFTRRWWNANVKDDNHRAIPIYADWNGDNWGGLDLKEDGLGVFFGEITAMTVDTVPTASGAGNDLVINMNVSYSAKLKNNKNEVRKGTMMIKLVPNEESTDPDHRALIDDVSFKVN